MKTNKILYQLDAGQKLTDCRGVFVDFVISGEVYRCDVVNGECIVPDELLQHPGNQTAYECMADNTLQEFVFSVVPRPLPPDYVYTPTEKLTFEGLVQKVEDTVADIIRRADTGEFDGYTPVKGKDYFTESEKNEMMQRVSDGAIGEFREVVDSATAGFNKNSSAKTNDYNANAEKKVGVYDSNAAEKLKAYNDNHTEKMTAYDANATDKLSTYNSNAEQKLEAYNSNHAAKVAEYNANAETKTAEFDSNAAALQTEVDRLRGECDTLAAENRKQENRISALMKLNKGQTYDILPEEGESASRTAPSGAKYVSVDKVGGKSIVWNQHPEYNTGTIISSQIDALEVRGKNLCPICTSPSKVQNGVNWHNNGDGTITATGVATDYTVYEILQPMTPIPNLIKGKIITISAGLAPTSNIVLSGFTLYDESNELIAVTLSGQMGGSVDMSLYPKAEYMTFGVKRNNNRKVDALITPMIEIGPTATPYKAYSLQTIPTNLPVLRSAGTAHDEINMDGGTIQRNIGTVDLGTLAWDHNGIFPNGTLQFIARIPGRAWTENGLCDKFEKSDYNVVGTYALRTTGNQITFVAPEGTEINAFIESVSGATLYYELEKPTTEPVTIPEALQEWLPVEPGGTVTFRNADESNQLPVPNAVSWLRKLNEVE